MNCTPAPLPTLSRRGLALPRPLELMYSVPAASLRAHPGWLDDLLAYPADGLRRWVQVHHGDLFALAPLGKWLGHRQVDSGQRAFLQDTISRCHARGVRVAWMVGKLTPPPELRQQHPGLADLHRGPWRALFEDAVAETFAALPDLDELSVYLFESPPFLDAYQVFGGFRPGADLEAWPYLAPADLLRELLQALSRACRAAGKSFSLLTHVWFPHQEKLLADALRGWPDDLPLLLEHNYSTGDFNPHLPENALLRTAPDLRHGLLFCGGLEYHGLAEIPFGCPELMQQRVASALDHTRRLERFSFRPVWEGRCLLGTANEVNLAAAVALCRDPWIDSDAVWDGWAERRFGGAAADVTGILREVSAANLAVMFQGGTRTNDHSRLPGFDYLRSRAVNYGKALVEWDPSPANKQAMWELLVSAGDGVLRRNRELHARAEATVARARERLAALGIGLTAPRGGGGGDGLATFLHWIRIHALEMEVFLRFVRLQRNDTAEERSRIRDVLEKLDTLAAALPASPAEGASELIAPERVGAFVAEARAALRVAPPGAGT